MADAIYGVLIILSMCVCIDNVGGAEANNKN